MTKPGDFFLLQADGWQSRLIRWGTHSHWSHTGLITSTAGDTVEALSGGVAAGTIARFAGDDYRIVDSGLKDAQRTAACAYAAACMGEPYDWYAILGFGINFLTDGNVVIGQSRTMTCSQLVASCYQVAGHVPPDAPQRISPGDLARWFAVTPQ